ncbi:hypothetical protein OEB94_00670 [Streptomyces sp. ICN988]|uniref:hypothetical protein n=1 Tax=Streptomyces sp. ICN988 TaxID=2983765 RepID=UPI0021E48483|nr:hypothetical protein [Streptomyces sp. ICN988]MCV2457815.1 hypothetical protein [Streptomyces sp. ICN988]
MDLFCEYGHDDDNLLPGSLITREGGARVTDADETPWPAASLSFIAAAPSLHADVLAILAGLQPVAADSVVHGTARLAGAPQVM